MRNRKGTVVRNHLHPEKVEKLVFCAFNSAFYNCKKTLASRSSTLFVSDLRHVRATGGIHRSIGYLIEIKGHLCGVHNAEEVNAEDEIGWEDVNDASLALLDAIG